MRFYARTTSFPQCRRDGKAAAVNSQVGMKKIAGHVAAFIRREKVFSIALLAAVLSASAVPPDEAYASYVDVRVLYILFSMMLVVAGLRGCGVFDLCATLLCRYVKGLRSLAATLVLLPFALSMFITNDVSLLLFVLSVLAVLKLVNAALAAAVAMLTILAMDRKALPRVDYMLLLTFAAFFVFTGNMERLEAVKLLLQKVVGGHEFLAGILTSQLISNVPAALLLYPFSESPTSLLLGVNVGGLGTLVASLANLISYKLYANRPLQGGADGGLARSGGIGQNYLLLFTAVNAAFLAILCAFHAAWTPLSI